jgi:hypothetical protein
MAIIERNLFGWQEINNLGDLKRLDLALKNMADEKLMKVLEKERYKGRNDYPVRAVWNSLIAGVVYGHATIESLRRELLRNAQLRQVCGFDLVKGEEAVPTASAYTYFIKKLSAHQRIIDKIFEGLVKDLSGILPDFGKELVIDSKAIPSYGKPPKDRSRDGRRDTDANWGVKTYQEKDKEGKTIEHTKPWFGYKVHIMADSQYELPIMSKLTKASNSDSPELMPMVKGMKQKYPEILKRAKDLRADRGYDSAENNAGLWDRYGIKPVIGIRQMQKDKEDIRLLNPDRADGIGYDEKGKVYCYCMEEGIRREMAYMGYEKGRKSLKYRCPASAYGCSCESQNKCNGKKQSSGYGRAVRISLDTDRRIFVPLARSSYAWGRAYKERTSIERINSRIDMSFGFENHYIRGFKKMRLRVSLAMIVMNSMALGHIRQKRQDKMRSLVSDWKIAA